MKQTSRRMMIAGILGLALSGCGNALEAEKLSQVSPDDLAKRGNALVVLSGEVNSDNMFAKSGRLRAAVDAMHLTRDAGTSSDRYNATEIIGPDINWIGPREIGDGGVREIPAGRYGLTQIRFGDHRGQAPLDGPYFATVDVGAGEVLYLGHLVIVTRKEGIPLIWQREYFKVGIESREAGAREFLRQKFPQFADRMNVRLMTIDPAIKLTEPPPAANLPLGATVQ